MASAARLKRGDDNGLPNSVPFKEGATYFVSTNVDVEDGLFNGSTGVLRKIIEKEDSNGNRIVTRVFMEFDDATVGALTRKKFFDSPLGHAFRQEHPDILPNYTEIGRFVRVLQKTRRNTRLQVVRSQIPLLPANGMTIHKSQVIYFVWT